VALRRLSRRRELRGRSGTIEGGSLEKSKHIQKKKKKKRGEEIYYCSYTCLLVFITQNRGLKSRGKKRNKCRGEERPENKTESIILCKNT